MSASGDDQPAADAPWDIIAVTDVPEARVLATIPRSTVLSARNSGLADVLRAERLGGGLALVAGVMYEAARGPQSKWYGYLASLPYREFVPAFWGDVQLRRLRGTDIEEKAPADREAMAADFAAHLAPLLQRYPARLGPLREGWTLDAFMRAASWVASRAFYVDEAHGDALVPLADVFNHKAARVDLRGGGWAEGFVVAEHADARKRQRSALGRRGSGEGSEDGEEGEEEGSEEEGEGEEEAASGSGSGGDGEGSSSSSDDGEESEEGDPADRPPLDRDPGDDGESPWPPPPPPPPAPEQQPSEARPGAAAGAAEAGAGEAGAAEARGAGLRGRWRLLAAEAEARGGPNLHLDIGICAVERGGVEVLDIVAAQPLARGREVFNTYGEHGNAELVNKYGFALPYNPFDELLLSKASLRAAMEAVWGRKGAQRRAKFLEEHSELLAEDEEPLLLLPPRHASTALFAALRAAGAADGELGGWASLEDALEPLRALHRRERGANGAAPGGDAAAAAGAKGAAAKEEDDAGASGGGGGKRKHGAGGAPAAKRGKGGGAGRAVAKEEEEEEEEGSDGDSEGEEEDDDLPEDVEIQPPSPSKAGSKPGSQPSDPTPQGKVKAPGKGGAKAQAKGKGKGKAAGAAEGGDGAEAAAAEDPVLWTDGMRRVLSRMVAARLAAYPPSEDSEGAEVAPAGAAAAAAKGKGKGAEGKGEAGAGAKGSQGGKVVGGEGAGGGGCTAAEAEVALRCAAVLREGEQRLLRSVAELLGGST
ncbi:hypothetical protein HYH03_002083 [Edaphochlamys debaryana]|uniref:SET domain-containing protein n=1 Tax=Edaphochlamys debaryana TaxID=47281 RepID=A0A835YBY2_9CHLO|nr:hypothetical protein HYH03_002083 [Edaphochlamys debaryana]|eukprot:KAG2499786.1 hypothetical protein HYH03_002083 [Edaphochlamys debaryana]